MVTVCWIKAKLPADPEFLYWADDLSFILDELGRSSESPITLNCPTTGLPPTAVFWQRSGESLANSGTYDITMMLRDRLNTTFDNLLQIYQTPQEAQAIYRCEAVNALDGPVQNRTSGAEITRGIPCMNMFLYLIAWCRSKHAVVWTSTSGSLCIDQGLLISCGSLC